MRQAQRIVAWLLIAGGTLHAAATPVAFDALSDSAMWFLAGGLMMVYVGFLNLAMADAAGRIDTLNRVTLLANLTAALFMVPLSLAARAPQPFGFVLLILVASVAGLKTVREAERACDGS
jgi:hypothetical protein